MDTIKLFWCGPRKIGREILVQGNGDIKILTGVYFEEKDIFTAKSGWIPYDKLDFSSEKFCNVDAFMYLADAQHLEKIADLAILAKKPLVVGFTELSESQLVLLQRYAAIIPIFYSYSCNIQLRAFTNEVIKRTRESHEGFNLAEKRSPRSRLRGIGPNPNKASDTKTFTPSIEAEALQAEVLQSTGQEIYLSKTEVYEKKNGPTGDWIFFTRTYIGCDGLSDRRLWCNHASNDQIARDIVKITQAMVTKPAVPDCVYSLKEIWNDVGYKLNLAED